MAELIDRAALLKALDYARTHNIGVRDAVKSVPIIDAEPVVHARWINEPERLGRSHGTFRRCSACGDGRWNGWSTDSAYCGMCGARMDADAPERDGKDVNVPNKDAPERGGKDGRDG